MGFDPATLAIASAVIGGIGTAVQVVGNIEAGQAAKANANYQAQVAANNAKIATDNARNAMQVGEQQQQQEQLKTRATVGAIVAAEGANNLDTGSGSNLLVKNSAQEIGELDANTIRQQASRTSWNYETQSAAFTGEEGLQKAEGAQAQTAGFINAGSSLLSGAATIGNQQTLYSLYGSGNVNPSAGRSENMV